MRKKVFQHAGALIIAAIILTFFTMSWAMYNNTAEQLRVSVRNECEYYRYFLDKMGDDSLDKPAGKITASRVTLIDTDGTVLFDSVEDENMMGNHSGRPEVIEAEKTGESNISRYSETLRSKNILYGIAPGQWKNHPCFPDNRQCVRCDAAEYMAGGCTDCGSPCRGAADGQPYDKGACKADQ